MGFNWLRKRALANEQTEIPGTTYTAPEIPMMNQPPGQYIRFAGECRADTETDNADIGGENRCSGCEHIK